MVEGMHHLALPARSTGVSTSQLEAGVGAVDELYDARYQAPPGSPAAV